VHKSVCRYLKHGVFAAQFKQQLTVVFSSNSEKNVYKAVYNQHVIFSM